MGLWRAKFLREREFRKFGAISLIAEARRYEKFRQFWVRTQSQRAPPSLFLSPLFLFCTSYVRYRNFRERYRYERAPSRTSAVNGAKIVRQIKKYGRSPMYRALARNYIRDFFPSIRRSSAMRHRLAELFPRKILAIFTRMFFSREMARWASWITTDCLSPRFVLSRSFMPTPGDPLRFFINISLRLPAYVTEAERSDVLERIIRI